MHPATVVVWLSVLLLVSLTLWYDRRGRPPARAPWGVWPNDERDLTAISRYALARPNAAIRLMDDRTWADLNLDDVFRVLDRTESLVGQQVLYDRLRSTPGTHLEAFEHLVVRFATDEEARSQAQRALRRIRRADAHELQWLLEPGSFAIKRWHVVFPILAVTMLGAALTASVSFLGVLLLLAGTVIAVALRATAARGLSVAGGAFRQVDPLLTAAAALRPLTRPETASLTSALDNLADLQAVRRVARWAGRDSSGAVYGEISGVIREYLNLLFALDGNVLYFGARVLRAHGESLLSLAHAVGEIDAALSVASYRAAVPGWARPTFTVDGPAVFEGLRHPLVPDAVPSSLTLAPPYGVIITGANMSGKTTLLRALGVNITLAQSIATCLLDRYVAPVLVVRSYIGRADDPATGRSYYLVEVESVLGLVAASRSTARHLFLFDELFRGTNTVERIAAGEAVLAALVSPPEPGEQRHVVVAATHDQELVDLLGSTYTSFHFSDQVNDDGLSFDYQLRPGAATTRNAIALLRLKGAPAALVAHATERARAMDAERRGRRSSPPPQP